MWMPFVLSMLLGRTFDADKFSTGQDIFSAADIADQNFMHEIPSYQTTVRCQLVQTESSKRDLLNIGAEVAIEANVKAVGVRVNPSMEYLSDKTKSEFSVEYVCRVSYTTVVKRLSADITPISGWTAKWDKKDLGTHFVRSIKYGGEMIASFNFKANTNHDIQRIAGALKAGVTIKGIGVDVGVKFDRFTDDLSKKAVVDVKYFSTTPITNVPSSLIDFRETVAEFVEEVKKVNGGLGLPVEAELRSLSELDSTLPAYLKNSVTKVQLETYSQRLADLMQADEMLQKWALTLQPLTDEQETQVGQMAAEIGALVKAFFSVGEKLEFSGGPEQLQSALDAYENAAEYNVPQRFTLKVRNLITTIGQSG